VRAGTAVAVATVAAAAAMAAAVVATAAVVRTGGLTGTLVGERVDLGWDLWLLPHGD
jgi:pseudouridine-5'-phosphate glycosidase